MGSLVVSRVERESVVVVCPDGTRLIIKVANIRGNKVRLGFSAPKDVAIHRSEVREAIMREEAGGHERDIV